ncbi:FAD-dependent oxidoreductase [Xinfangfangia sp. CPCC 101601]|uniref:FAD-dependent oxidoreductase n=1 Tax=Pseudogemmobacter lacusdianii TaxID=3069608 RepID=A0ABU0W2A5_9RHOB|nr:FAD-dependent oxidoreductase [Xinfangfangia sp. CPCC 101601]MDQ2068150.1 FAD-dependent oxidoreductase [Xinfangfangia sp. CPCC 101601]
MTTEAQVLIIGGGAMGVSLMYHLVKAGWKDVILTEKNDLTHGSTWHAAGLCTHFAHNPTIQELRATSVRLYRDILPAETGESCGFHRSGAMRITSNPDRMDEFAHVAGLSKFTGYELRLLKSPQEVAALHPLARTEGILGGIYEPDDGHVDPTLATNAMAKVATAGGAVILRRNPVLAIRREGNAWLVECQKGTIRAKHIVNAAGTWGWEIGAMMGANVPSVPVLHQYLVTDTVPAVAERIAAGLPELPMIRDPEESWYVRQERDALILGPYEKDAQVWSVDGVPPEFGAELMAPDLDRVEHILMAAMARIPALETGGVKSVVNGPITFTPDANPLIGPAWGLPNAWMLTGSSMGVMEGGGSGWFLAHWMTHGAPPMDALAVDSRRFGPWADRDYRVEKAIECFGLQFGVHYPYEERPAARGKRLTPLYDLMKARGAQMGAAYGWERPNWFGDVAKLTFRRPDWSEAVAQECRMVSSSAGLADMSVFSKFEITGKDARAYVDALGCNLAPKSGRVGLTYALSPAGGTESEFTVACLAEDHFYLTSAAAAEMRDDDLLRARAAGMDVTVARVTDDYAVIGLMGPKSQQILEALSSDALGPWMSVRQMDVAGIPVRAMRLSYVGESGWELHVQADRAAALFLALEGALPAGEIGCFGAYAMNAMRLEKGYAAWGSDFTTERTPAETGMGFLVKPDHDFIGREALLKRMAAEDRWDMVLLEIDPAETDPYYAHGLWQGDRCVGVVTSAAYGHRTDKVLSLAYLRDRKAREGLEVEVLGTRRGARILTEPPYDPKNLRMRG